MADQGAGFSTRCEALGCALGCIEQVIEQEMSFWPSDCIVLR